MVGALNQMISAQFLRRGESWRLVSTLWPMNDSISYAYKMKAHKKSGQLWKLEWAPLVGKTLCILHIMCREDDATWLHGKRTLEALCLGASQISPYISLGWFWFLSFLLQQYRYLKYRTFLDSVNHSSELSNPKGHEKPWIYSWSEVRVTLETSQ